MTENESTKTTTSSDQIKKEFKEAKRRENEELKEKQRQQNIRKNPEWMWDLQYDNFGNLKRSLYFRLPDPCQAPALHYMHKKLLLSNSL